MSLSQQTHSYPNSPVRIHLSPGCYCLWDPRGSRVELRTDLLDLLENAPNLTRKRLSPFITYIRTALVQRKRMSVPRSQPTKSFLTSFTLFPKLPVELQCMIWNAALPGPRIIPLKTTRPQFLRCPQQTRLQHLPILSVALANYQAHTVVCRRYERVEALFHPSYIATHDRQTYFADFEKDVFQVDHAPARWHMTHHKYGLDRARNVAIRIDACWWFSHQKSWIPGSNLDLPGKNVIFVADCEGFCARCVDVGEWKKDGDLEPLVRTKVEEEPDHPLLGFLGKKITAIKEMLENEEVKEEWSRVKTSFEIWRRPGQLEGRLW